MSILIRRVDGGTFEPVNGHVRLRASLEVFGKATVTDMDTQETFDVHMVNGQIVILDDGKAAIAETIAVAAIERAAHH